MTEKPLSRFVFQNPTKETIRFVNPDQSHSLLLPSAHTEVLSCSAAVATHWWKTDPASFAKLRRLQNDPRWPWNEAKADEKEKARETERSEEAKDDKAGVARLSSSPDVSASDPSSLSPAPSASGSTAPSSTDIDLPAPSSVSEPNVIEAALQAPSPVPTNPDPAPARPPRKRR